MKALILFVAIAGGVYTHGVYRGNPAEISDPVYVEARFELEFPALARELESVVIAEMASFQECEDRSERFLETLFEKCKECQLKRLQCRAEIAPRYKKLFAGKPTHTTYLSFDKGSRFERSGRMVIWGLKGDEAQYACKMAKQRMQENYNGTVSCVRGRLL